MRLTQPWVRSARWLLAALVTLAILVGLMRDTFGAIGEGTPAGTTSTGASSVSWSHTTASGSNRLLLVRVVNINTNISVTAVTYGGTALTQLATVVSSANSASAVRASLWYLVAPAVATATVQVNLSGSTKVGAGSQSYTGVAQSSSFGPVATSVATTGTGISSNVTTTGGDLVVDTVAVQGVSVSSTLSPGSGQSGYSSSSGGSSSDVGGGASSKAASASTTMSWTSGASSPWAHAAVAMKAAGSSIAGTVFEDKNYGGGAGRNLSASNANGGGLVNGATVELYSSTGVYITRTTTASDGTYSFNGLASSTNYFVRVASSTVRTTRSCNNGCGGTLPVMTFRTTATTGSAVGVTDWVGGTNPASADPGTASSGATFNTSSYVFSAGLSGTAHAVAPVTTTAGTGLTGVDFGFSFDVVSNNNDTGQGSLRQFLANANEIIASGLAISGGVANLDNAIFMISNGTAAAGLRSTLNYFSGGVTTINLTSAYPTVIGCVIDARNQPGWAGTPLVVVNGSGAGASTDGFRLNGQNTIGGVTLAGFTIQNFTRNGVSAWGNGNTIKANRIGLNAAGTAAAANGDAGIKIGSGSSGDVVGGTGTYDGNVTSGNSGPGIEVLGSNTVIQGNITGLNAAGTAAVPNGGDGITLQDATTVTVGGSSAAARNVISGNNASTADGIWITGGSGHTIKGNYIGLNAAGSATVANAYAGIAIFGSSNNTIGGTAAGEANIIAGNTGNAIQIELNGSTAANGNKISGNSIYSNTGLGIDLGNDGVTANNSSTATTLANNGMDFPVISTATISAGTLALTGYVGSAANQTAFANAVVEFFIADTNAAGNGEGKTYLGTLTADGSGNFSGSITGVSGITGGTTRITGTARDSSGNSSEFGANVVVTQMMAISGTVFEDLNYGGGPGRDNTAAGAAGVSGARVELYNGSGTYASVTTTSASGAYSFTGLGAGAYFVRVVNSTVQSTRSGSTASLVPVMTYRTETAATTVSGVLNEVGGLHPVKVDAGNGGGGTALWTSCAAENGTCSFSGTKVVRYGANSTAKAGWATLVLTGGTACSNAVFGDPNSGAGKSCYLLNADYQSISTVNANAGDVAGVDFGFNFDTVVNVNDAGQGSLRQAITNANTLTGDASLAMQARTAGIEHIVFMVSNGTTGSGGILALAAGGLRSGLNYFSSGVATIAPATALPALSTSMMLDGQTQPGWTANPIIELNGTSTAAGTDGLTISGTLVRLRGLVINRFKRHGVYATGASATVHGCWIGLNNAGTAASANSGSGIYTAGTGHTIGSTTSYYRNVISGNTQYGIALSADSGSTGTSTVTNNYIGTNAAGTAAVANGAVGVYVLTTGNTIGGAVSGAGNVISGNSTNGLQMDAGPNTVQGNVIGLNAAGTAAIANTNMGLYIGGGSGHTVGGTSSLQRNVISGNGGGIFVNAGGSNTFQGNYIGTAADGASAIGNSGYFGLELYGTGNNTVGGTVAGAGNLISGQTTAGKGGIYLASNSNTVQGNNIGTNAAGTAGLANAGPGVAIVASSITGNTIGGTAAGAGNVIAYNGQQGVAVTGGSSTGNKISRNAIYSNTGIGIDIAAGGRNANNGTKSATLGNQEMDTPVLTAAIVNGSTMVVSGYVGSAASQSTFGSATVEIFKVASDGTGYGQGQTYLGSATADANGNFSAQSIAVSGVAPGDVVTATATDASGNTSEFSANFTTTGLAISGFVYEDLNYGGGAGRNKLASTGSSGRSGARVELYTVSGTTATYSTATTTDGVGAYTFSGLSSGNYAVRVVSSSVTSSRTGYTAGLLSVMTYRADASSGTAVDVTDNVGGNDPAATGAGSATTGAVFNTGTGVYSAGNTGSAKSYTLATVGSSGISSVDFGFNFDTVVNTNDTGVGSLRQAITNANTLGGDASLAQAGRTAGVENLVFMISNGTAAAGLRSANNYFATNAGSYSVATLQPTSEMPVISTTMVVDAQTQPGWSLNPIIELRGDSAGAVSGLTITASSTVLRGFVINRFANEGVHSTAGNNITVQGCWIGVTAAGSAAAGNGLSAVWMDSSGTGHLVGGTTAAQRNVLSGSIADEGVAILGGSGHVVQGNYIGTNAAGTGILANGREGVKIYGAVTGASIGGTSAAAANVIAGNAAHGVAIATGATGISVLGNSIYGNGSLGIDLNIDGISANDGAKTAGQANLKMDAPVFTAASLSGTTLTVSGYVGSAAGQGKTWLGFLTTDANGNFSGSITGVSGLTAGTSKLTGTATDASGNTSEFGVNYAVGYVVSGTVFEDINYSGGAGRSLAGSGGTVLGGATVELFNSSGTYVSSTTTSSAGTYSFSNLAAANYYVRVVSASVLSTRSGSSASLVGLMTYRTTASSGAAVAQTDYVGGTDPSKVDPGAASAGAAFNTSTFVFSAVLAGTAQNVTPVTLSTTGISGLDFGFNFDTVANTNDAGQGSLRQAITNANTLSGDAALAQAGRTAAIENLVFMISNGTTGSGGSLSLTGGLRSANNYFVSGAVKISPTSALPDLSTPMVIDGQAQPGWTAVPLIELNGAGAGANVSGLTARGGVTLRGLIVNYYTGSGVQFQDAGSNVLQGSYVGTNASGSGANPNGGVGVNVYNSPNNTIGGTGSNQGNVISGNTGNGINLSGSSSGAVITGNTIGLNVARNTRVANGSIGIYANGGAVTIGGTSVAARNVITGNAFENIQIASAAGSSSVQGNYIGTNGSGATGITNGSDGLYINGASNVAVGGTAAGAANVIAGNAGRGVLIVGAGSGNAVQGNSIFGNANIGIDLGNNGVTVNDGVKTAGQPNLLMDYPVINAASLSGTTLTVSGYVGSAASQSTFASARVEVFVSDGTNTNGQGQTWLGYLTADANGNFSGSITGVSGLSTGTTKFTATATDGSGNTSEFGPNFTLGGLIAGTVFEDTNYGGGAGRSLAASGGAGVAGATVELFDSTGTYVRSTTTAVGGGYSFGGLNGGNFYVRVVSASVLSSRSGSTASLVGVLTYRTTAASGSVVAVTDYVGGTTPSAVDPGAATTGAAFNTSTSVFSAGLSGTAQNVAPVALPSGTLTGVDFGFNFDTVVNTNDSGQGSLRQAITNANTLGGDAALAVAGQTAGKEAVLFMISNGTASAGLRSANNYTTGGIATLAPASKYGVTATLVLAASTQPGWAATQPVVEVNAAGVAGSNYAFDISGAGSTLRGFIINRAPYGAVQVSGGTSTVAGNWIGVSNTGLVASANATGIEVASAGNTIGGATAADRNVVSGNFNGIALRVAAAQNNVISGNYIGVGANGSTAIGNTNVGIYVYNGAQNNRIGGTAAGEGNVIANGKWGVQNLKNASYAAVPGIQVTRNSFYANSNMAIELANNGVDGIDVNDGVKDATKPNNGMDQPVFTSASLSGTTLSVGGYVGSAAGQAAFAAATVEVFISDATQANGQGKTWLGTLAADASGNFSGSITGVAGVTNGSTRITATATDASGNTSEFGPNLLVGQTLSGTVFEDVNYGGGAGRSQAGSSGAGLSGATVELFDKNGAYVSSTTTAAGGSYSFVGVGNGNYFVRVASTTVASQRSGSVATLRGVMTYRTTATTGTAVAVTDWVGGTDPAQVDPAAATIGAAINTSTYVFSAGLTGTAHAVAPVTTSNASIASLDFGFNFDTVVNTNGTGQGSLREAIGSANTLGGDASLAQAGRTAGIENVIFMISNGTAGAGLRSTLNYFSAGVATISPTTAMPTVSTTQVIDAQTQPGWAGTDPIVRLSGSGAGSSDGLTLSAASSVLRGFIIGGYAGSGVQVTGGASGSVVQGNWLGLNAAGTAAQANTARGLSINGVSALTVGGTSAAQRNVMAGNSQEGVYVTGASGVVIAGNYIGTNAAGAAAVANGGTGGIYIVGGSNGCTIGGTTAGARNVIAGNTMRAITIEAGSHTLQGNYLGLNAAGSAALVNSGGSAVYLTVSAGAQTVGGTSSAARNVIVSSSYHGINVAAASATGTSIQGNYFGTDAAGTAVLGSSMGGVGGVYINNAGTGIAVGGTAAGAGNLIRGYGTGVIVASGSGNSVLGNSIYGNGGIGIDLKNDGVTANDGVKTTGQPNLLMDSPVFTSARATGNQLTAAGYIGTAAGQTAFANARVEIFVSDNDSTGYGEGKTYLGALTADANGNFSGTVTLPVSSLPLGSKLTATATDGSSNTSEFGANFAGLVVDLVVNSNLDEADTSAGDGSCLTASGVCTLRAAIAELNASAAQSGTPSIVFAIPGCSSYGSAGCKITPATALPSVTRTVLLDASTQAGFNTSTYAPLIELSGSSAPAGTVGLVVASNNATVRGLAINRFTSHGLTLSGSGGTLVGLRVGLNVTAASAAANGGSGFYITGSGATVGGSAVADRNVVAGNTGSGIVLAASGATLSNNFIGTDSAGAAGLGNGASGVFTQAASLSGISLAGNTIVNNGGNGVTVAGGAAQVQMLGNSFSGNGSLGIDLGNDGVTANTGATDSTKPNNGINQPVITGAGVGSTSMTVYGYVGIGTGQGVFANARVEFFKAASDASGYGEGQTYLGFLTTDANGRFSGTVAFANGAINVGDPVTATVTDSAGNTSEFGPNWTTTSVAALTPGNFNAFDTDAAANALNWVIRSRIAGTAANIAVIALDNNGTALHPGFTGNVTLTWVDARNDTGAITGSCRSSWVDAGAAGTAAFSNNARVTVSVTPPASATRAMRLKMSYTSGGGSTVTACSNDAFAVLPASYNWLGATDTDSSTAGTTRTLSNTGASGGNVHRAGRPFTVRAQALDATGAIMTGYDGTPVLATAGCLLPASCTAATLTAASTAAVAGVWTHNNVSYAEVGAIQVQLTDASYADVDAADTAIGVRTLTSALLAVGRFIPDSYSVALSTSGQFATANGSCMAAGSGATFIGQGFTWATAPQLTLTARNAAGATTAGWTGSLMKLTPAMVSEALAASGTGSATLSSAFGAVAVADLGSGQARVTASATDRFLLDLAGGAVQDSVTPSWTWTATVADTSEAAISGNPTLNSSASQGSIAFNSGAVFHSGRLGLSPGYGDVRAGVKLLAQLQRYTSAGWVTLTEDQGCVTINTNNVGVEAPVGVFTTAGSCAAPMQAAVTTRGGRAWISLPATPGGAPGRLTLRLAGGGATGNSCTPAGASAALVGMGLPWLMGGSSAAGPQAFATWGSPQRDAVLRRETW